MCLFDSSALDEDGRRRLAGILSKQGHTYCPKAYERWFMKPLMRISGCISMAPSIALNINMAIKRARENSQTPKKQTKENNEVFSFCCKRKFWPWCGFRRNNIEVNCHWSTFFPIKTSPERDVWSRDHFCHFIIQQSRRWIFFCT